MKSIFNKICACIFGVVIPLLMMTVSGAYAASVTSPAISARSPFPIGNQTAPTALNGNDQLRSIINLDFRSSISSMRSNVSPFYTGIHALTNISPVTFTYDAGLDRHNGFYTRDGRASAWVNMHESGRSLWVKYPLGSAGGALPALLSNGTGARGISLESWDSGAQVAFTGATSTLTIADGGLSTTRACASGYVRTNVNTCSKTTTINAVGIAAPTTCTQIALPAGAKTISLIIDLSVAGRSTLNAQNESIMQFYIDVACTTPVGVSYVSALEFVATASITARNIISTILHTPASVLYAHNIGSTTGSTVFYQLRAYTE